MMNSNKPKRRLNGYECLELIFFDAKKIRFILIGVLNTIFSYIIFALLVYLEVKVKYALIFSTVAGVIFNYFSYKGVVFKKKASAASFIKHISAYCVIYFLNIQILSLISRLLNLNFYLAQLICIPILVMISWVLMNRWVYK